MNRVVRVVCVSRIWSVTQTPTWVFAASSSAVVPLYDPSNH